MSKGSISNAIKHVENASTSGVFVQSQLVHTRAALYIAQHPMGGNRSKRVVDSAITRHLIPDARGHNLQFVMMLVGPSLPTH